MNTPPMGPEQQLTPKMSPIMMHLDDNLSSLSNPSFMHLDDAHNKKTGGYSAMYRTSLSKLTERGRQGRGRSADPKTPTKILRSNSPIRALLGNAPKMLKPEYMGVSRLLNNSKGASSGPITTPSMILTNSKLLFHQVPLSHQEQQQQQQKQQHPAEVSQHEQSQQASSDEVEQTLESPFEPLFLPQKVPEKAHSREISSTCSLKSTVTAYEPEPRTESQLQKNTAPKLSPDAKRSEQPAKAANYRFPSATSTASSGSTLDNKEYHESLNFEVPSLDKDEFMLATQSKRSSYISSVGSTNDDDLNGWFAQYTDERQVATLNISDAQNNRQQVDTLRERSFQTEHFSLKVKQLELSIAELRLQNEQLRHTMTTHRTVQDRYMFDALHDVQREKENSYKEMNRKMRQLEKQIDNYKRVVQKLTAPVNMSPAVKPRIPLVDALTLDELSEANSSSGDETESEVPEKNENDNDHRLGKTTTITLTSNDETSPQMPESPRKRLAGIKLGLTFEK
ncbi:LAFA_0B04104g1_1 [Lachancea sp. 'fantastica']|nr:LAFA_0B04104g1_1 [Lachancea sp. 'fantastica']